jgi:hypothetical protein
MRILRRRPLAQKTEAALKYRNFGKKSLNEIKDNRNSSVLGSAEVRSRPVEIPLKADSANSGRGIVVRQVISLGSSYEAPKKPSNWDAPGTPESPAGESGLQSDRASADQDHSCQGEGGPPLAEKMVTLGKTAHSTPPDSLRCCAADAVKKLPDDIAPQREPPGWLHPHHQARPTQE